jgi:hypothetical protein
MAKRLAITIAGAVSLGSYEAGVMWEVLDAIGQHNANPQTSAEEKIVVDVVTGASAGGMTAVILAQKLLYYGPLFAGPYDNPLYDTWVKRISLAGLQATGPDELATHSLFSSDLIESIAADVLLSRYAATGPVAPQQAHGAVVATEIFRVGVAMTNLDGVDYGYPVRLSRDNFIYREYADQMTRRIEASAAGTGCDTPEFWTPLREAAVACGAFPVAFRSKDMYRSTQGLDAADYPPGHNMELWNEDPRLFTYADGGMVQNQPIGMAKDLVDEADNHIDQENRFYLFVSPHAKDPAPDNYHEANGDYLHLALQLITAVSGQAGFRDWITAEGVNERVKLMDTRATGLMHGIVNGTVAVAPLQATATALLDMLFEDDKNTPPGSRGGPEHRPDAQLRISRQYAEEMTQLANIPGAQAAFRDSMLAFETAAGLGERDVMKIYGVTATDAQLAGAGLQAFLGFFDQQFRDHDYDVGRKHAQAFLTNSHIGDAGEIGPIRFTPGTIRYINDKLDGLKLATVQADYSDDLDGFETGMKARVDKMLDETISKVIKRDAAKFAAHGVLTLLFDWLVKKE